MVARKKSSAPRKRKPRVLHVALHLPTDGEGLYTRGSAMWSAVKADTVHFPTPYPPATETEPDLKGLGTALQDAAGKDPVAIAALGVAAAKVKQDLELLGKYVQSVLRAGPIEDAPAILSNVLMYESNIGVRPPKPELAAKQPKGTLSGTVLLVALAVAGAAAYYWESSVDQVAWAAGGQSAQARFSLAGLTPGKMYYFRFHTLQRAGGLTSPSQVVGLMVT